MHQYVDAAPNLQAEVARQPSPIRNGVLTIEAALDRIRHAIGQLEDRLQPVLCPVGPDDPPLSPVSPAPPRSDVAAVLFTNGDLLDGQAARLEGLLARLEV